MGFTNNHHLSIIRDLPSRLTRSFNGSETVYEVKPNSFSSLLVDAGGETVTTGAIGVSANGEWMAAEVMNIGLVLVKRDSGEIRMFSDDRFTYGVGLDVNLNFVISDDGRYVAMFHHNITPKVYTFDGDCGLVVSSYRDLAVQLTSFRSCPSDEGRLNAALQEKFGARLASFKEAVRFSYTNDTLYFQRIDYNEDETENLYETPLYAGNFQAAPLDYLALGDSYSSGEGDTARDRDGNKYYREYTNVSKTDKTPEEKCHISTRSYPYLLAENMELGEPGYVDNTRWQTVACSGAEAGSDYRTTEDYKGQGARLEKVTKAQRDTYKTAARNNYIPGRIQQFEYVKLDQPKSLTLTAGGNDVGFGYILKKCAESGDTCDYAEGHEQTATLARTILGEQSKLKDLYTELHNLSPKTKIYVVGYPQFISNKNKCGINVQLDDKERKFVRQGVEFMNDVIEAAAKEAGVRYVDVEDSIGSHGLCGEGDIYVSGINRSCVPWLAWTSGDDCQESFHPNDRGQNAMSSKIVGDVGDLRDYEYCDDGRVACPAAHTISVDAPPLFKDALDNEAGATQVVPEYRRTDLASTNYTRKNPVGMFDIMTSGLQPGSEASMVMASDPVSLGTYRVDDNGELNVSVAIPNNIPAGRHTLYVDTKTFSGEPLRLWQIVTVYGADGDLDEDGIQDEADTCLFANSSGTDTDADGIDDACDVEIGPKVVKAQTSQGQPLLSFTGSKIGVNSTARYGDNYVDDGSSSIPDSHQGASNDRATDREDTLNGLVDAESSLLSPIVVVALAGSLVAVVAYIVYTNRREQ
jgi:hypothetical protein